jgi:hypothetical protein
VFVVNNTLKIQKKTFKKLFGKFEFHVSFILDVVICACILHNMLRFESESHTQRLMHIINLESQKDSQIRCRPIHHVHPIHIESKQHDMEARE